MGIDFRWYTPVKSKASWSYSGFKAFRIELAKLVGINLMEMVGFGGDVPWPEPRPDPIHIFLDHSDCDGQLTAEECFEIGPRLVLLSLDLSSGYDRKMAYQLGQEMMECGRESRALEFC
jgi:hypothetical protein